MSKIKPYLLTILTLVFPFFAFAQEAAETAAESGIDAKIEQGFKPFADFIGSVIFFSIPIAGKTVPIVLIILIASALFFTFFFKFANIRYMKAAINTVRGKYNDADPVSSDIAAGDPTPGGDIKETIRKEDVVGEVTQFQALSAALSATVGLGNIAGVAVAIAVGGPGATIWMIIAGLLGMSTKMVEATLGVKYREVGEDGKIYGGPMYYLKKGLAEKNMGVLGKILAVFFAIMVVGGSLGGGNMFQANQAAAQMKNLIGLDSGFIFGIIMAVLVGLVIIGGIKRIGKVAEKIVPIMGLIYVGASLIIIFMNITLIPEAIMVVIRGAFSPMAALGGVIGVMITGFQRAAFSNEAGVGSSSIAHSAVKTKYPASEGLVASIEPFVDTVIICSMTAMVIVVMNLKDNLFNYGDVVEKKVLLNATGERIGGVDMTSLAFENAIPYFSIVLAVAVILFAFSTMLSWSYYGLQGWKYLFGKGKVADTIYKIMFLLFVVIGASSSLGSVIDFSDAMIFAMVFPNVIGLFILTPVVKKEIKKYIDVVRKVDSEQKAKKGK